MVDRTSLQTIIYDAILIALTRRGFLYLALPITPCALTFPPLETSCKTLRRRETLTVYPHWASLKNMPGHDGNRTYDLWNASPMLCQLSYAVWSVRVSDISEQNLVPSISKLSNNNHDFSVLV